MIYDHHLTKYLQAAEVYCGAVGLSPFEFVPSPEGYYYYPGEIERRISVAVDLYKLNVKMELLRSL